MASHMLTTHAYGKSGIRVARIDRHDDRDEFHEITVEISLEGEFEGAYLDGDNATVLPTDTMKNTVYAMAHDHPISPIEPFALHLALHFVSEIGPVNNATIEIQSVRWQRVGEPDAPHRHAFTHGGDEVETCSVEIEEDEPILIRGGLAGLTLLKTTDSAFEGFLRDQYTTLKDESDRILGTTVTANWTYAADVTPDYDACREVIREALIDTFADHDSRSVQETLYAMASAALDACDEIDDISLSLPNLHYLPVDMAPFDRENDRTIFMPTDVPHGMIEATVRREGLVDDDDDDDDEGWDFEMEFVHDDDEEDLDEEDDDEDDEDEDTN